MNERARELVEQAGMVYWPNKQLDKFAELIVKEVFAKIEDERFEV
jgi:precorrin-6B methylase 1